METAVAPRRKEETVRIIKNRTVPDDIFPEREILGFAYGKKLPIRRVYRLLLVAAPEHRQAAGVRWKKNLFPSPQHFPAAACSAL